MIKVVPKTWLLLENLMVSKCIPRIRGVVPDAQGKRTYPQRVFPAYAGLFRTFSARGLVRSGIPRIRGVVPLHNIFTTLTTAYSPHTRGCSGGCSCCDAACCAIPRIRGVVPLVKWEVNLGVPVFPAYAGLFLYRK